MKQQIERIIGKPILALKKLEGYDNNNYKVTTQDGSFIFKTYPYSEATWDLVIAENEVLDQLQQKQPNLIPKPICFSDGKFQRVIKIENKKKICRILTFLEGSFLGEVAHTTSLFVSFGKFLANFNQATFKIKNYVYASRTWEWDLQHVLLNKKKLPYIKSHADRNLVAYFFQQFEEHVTPLDDQLRKGIIHNDANEWNLLVQNGRISGIIDFGDLAYSYLINELAVAITYACYDKEHPVSWAVIIVKAYHAVFSLEEKEIQILYYLIAARLCISVCNSAYSRKLQPENEYISVSEKPAWAMLYKWIKTNPIYFENELRKTVGLTAHATNTIQQKLKHRHQYISTSLSVSYDTPIYLKRAAFQYMYDGYGNTFLDAYNNIPHVGHSHPNVVAAGRRQMGILNTNTRYLYDILPAYAEKLLSKFPANLNKVFFVNSGSAASDLAIRMAKTHTKNDQLMVMEHGYHGNTQLSMEISDYKFNNSKGHGQQDYIIKTKIPDTFRGKYTNNDGSAGEKYARDAIALLEKSKPSLAAFVTEPVVGCGGQVPLAKNYLKTLYPVIRKLGGICISDEVQTGFGRLGDHFWGFEAQEVIPDMVILGKPMGNGHPIGAVVCTDEIAKSFEKGVEFFSSFGGNPVSCAIGMAVLEVIEEEKLQANAKLTGDYYLSLLKQLQQKFNCIGDVRGSGLFIGVELVKEGTLQPDTKLAHYIKNELRKKHILISTDGPFDSVLKTKPPLIFTKKNAKTVVDALEQILVKYHN